MVDISVIPVATLLIMLVAISLSLMNNSLNRLIISKMFGWNQYRTMQKEIADYNAERMKALRANDTKTLERLKKREAQVNSMQTKMFKPQLVQLPLMLIYFIIWPALTGIFSGTVAYIPGLGEQPFYIWYLICSFFFATITGRIIGTTPIQ
ncbi:MAG: DUF106 domain-containing protein [Crenarchaeota archaeon]|nr:DUF106 domain-containing protein [Thermoproteota archaeon]